jgi:hydrogenase maturation protease
VTAVPRTLVLGIGNTLLTDEGAGIHVIAYLCKHHPPQPDVTYLDGGTLSFTLAEQIGHAENLIVIDAARIDAPPGTVRCLVGREMDEFVGSGKLSVHEVGLADLMDIARLTGCLPRNRALIAIQPGELGWGDRPGKTVAAAIPAAAEHALDLISRWREARREPADPASP